MPLVLQSGQRRTVLPSAAVSSDGKQSFPWWDKNCEILKCFIGCNGCVLSAINAIVSRTAYTLPGKGAIFSGDVSGKISGLGRYWGETGTKRKAGHLKNTGIPPMRFFLKNFYEFPEIEPERLIVKSLSSR